MNSPWMLHGLMALLVLQIYLNFRLNGLVQGALYAVLAGAGWSLGWAVICWGHNLFTSAANDWHYLNLWAHARTLADVASFNLQLLMTGSPSAWMQISLWPGAQALSVGDRIHMNLFMLLAYAHVFSGTSSTSPANKTHRPTTTDPQSSRSAPQGGGEQEGLLRLASGHIDYRAYVNPAQVRNLAVQLVSAHAGGEREKLLQAAALFEHVKSRVNYISDPIAMRGGLKELGDFLATPADTLQIGGGDCDDQALLMASLLSAVGLENRILFVSSPTNGAHLLTQFSVDVSLADEIPTILEQFYDGNSRAPGQRIYLPFSEGDRVWLMADTTREYVGDFQSLVQQDFLQQLPNGLIQWHSPPKLF